MRQVIQGLEEGLNAIADALEGSGGGGAVVPTPAAADEGKVLTANDDGTASWETPSGGGGIPTPTLNDEGKVLKAIPQTQTTVAPEWASIREVPTGGREGQVLTKSYEGYEWENSSGLPALYDEDNGKVLMGRYDSDTENVYPEWSIIRQVPSGGTTGQVLTKSASGYGWANASGGGGGGNIDVIKFDIAKAQFNQDGDMYKVYASTEDPDIATKINNIISISIVDNVDEGYPDLINPATGEFSIYYEDELVTIKISSTIYNKLGMRGNNHFYMTYYKGV